ncbi:hydantoinase/carbamoylase family amidase [Nakamurella sp. YIM 132087]|uniref:Hydantoinase/carbamoylase family amidase n=1 Tax=Nakamurella alba TaxID=2665158 RepID=A0A7K1FK20_9ACTN|nr:M20 family metallo-hydrolase [Nakamurella alba]MTD13204.1 hydantoinase/carbamoylase family amidase [Nakamurella alba]
MSDQTLSPAATHPGRDAGDNRSFIDDFVELSAFGATPAGGVERQAATAEDGEMRSWLAAWLDRNGFTVEFDRVGNMFGLREFAPGAPWLLAGSHLDSQPRGGKYDGAYGVLAAAHALHRVVRGHETAGTVPGFNFAVVNWFNEEGSRFKPSMMGSGVFTGKIPLEKALTTTDVTGVSVGEALGAIGSLGAGDAFGDGTGRQVGAYAEIHIEQGRELDKSGIVLGLVDSTWGANKYEIAVTGAQSHTGATAIADRQDALYGAALVVVALRELADRFGEDLHTSCGQLTVYPNSPVVVAREVYLHLDLRSPSDDLLDEADALLRRRFAEIEVQADVQIERRFAHTWKGQQYQSEGVDLAAQVVTDLGVSSMKVQTRAGHDSTNMKDTVPTVMLFVPSVDGVSHAENEYTTDEDLCTGVDVLTEVLHRMAGGALS